MSKAIPKKDIPTKAQALLLKGTPVVRGRFHRNVENACINRGWVSVEGSSLWLTRSGEDALLLVD